MIDPVLVPKIKGKTSHTRLPAIDSISRSTPSV